MRILVVEDNQINQQVAEELLNSEGANVSLAANGQLGVDAVRFATPQFDAVLMDIQMPVMDGFTATRVIREHLGFMDLPIIAMTANAMNSDRDDCLAAGMNAHVGKPFELSALVKTLLSASGYGVPVGASWSVPASPSMGLGATTPPKAAAVSGHTGGIDLGSALARLSGMESLYLRAAKEFVKVLPTVMMEFRQLLETDRKQATMQMHTLKGNSALLGATALAEVTGQLEAQCKSSVSTGEIAAQIPHLERTLHACGIDLQAVIVQLGAAEPLGPAALPSVTGTGGLHARLVELGTLLANGDLEALSLFAQLRPQFPADLQAELNSLEEALQDLELEAARIHCLALIANLGIANGRSTP